MGTLVDLLWMQNYRLLLSVSELRRSLLDALRIAVVARLQVHLDHVGLQRLLHRLSARVLHQVIRLPVHLVADAVPVVREHVHRVPLSLLAQAAVNLFQRLRLLHVERILAFARATVGIVARSVRTQKLLISWLAAARSCFLFR